MEVTPNIDLVGGASISFKEYGPPTVKNLLDNFYRKLGTLRQLKIRSAGEPAPWPSAFLQPEGSQAEFRVYTPIEFQELDKGDDRIFSGYVSGYPTIIVADGVSVIESATGQSIVGKGGEAAEEATLTTLETLSQTLKVGLDSLEIYDMLEQAFIKSSASLEEKNLRGASTLLIGFLYEHRREGKTPKKMWYYAYEGDGEIAIISPHRRVDGLPTSLHLLSPQKVEHTAAVSAQGSSVNPVIGSVEYIEDDLLYLHSDGMSHLNQWLRNNKRVANLKTVISEVARKKWDNTSAPAVEIASTIRDYPFGDDAVLGVITTRAIK